MSNWFKSILIGLGVASIFSFLRINALKNELNTQFFNINYIIQINPLKDYSDKDFFLEETPLIIKKRAEAAGFAAQTEIVDKNKFGLKLQMVDDTVLAQKIITSNNKIEFKELYTLDQIPAFITLGDELAKKIFKQPVKRQPSKEIKDTSISPEVKKLLEEMEKDSNTEEVAGLSSLLSLDVSNPPSFGSVNQKDTMKLNQLLKNPELLSALPGNIRFYYGQENAGYLKNKSGRLFLYAIKDIEEHKLQNKDIKTAAVDFSPDGKAEINIHFNEYGARRFEIITQENQDRFIAILINDMVISAPRVMGIITGGNLIISGAFTVEEAKNLAAHLSSGMIPAELKIIKQEILPVKSRKWKITFLFSILVFAISAAIAQLILKFS